MAVCKKCGKLYLKLEIICTFERLQGAIALGYGVLPLK
jgi:hypothetical protein